MLPVLLTFLLPILLGLSACLLLATYTGKLWVLIWAAPGAGIGITSVVFFLWSLLFYPRFAPGLYVGLEILLLVGLVVLLWRRRARLDLQWPWRRMGALEALLGLALAAALVFFAYRFIAFIAVNPISVWDAWSIWNSRARFFLLGDAQTWRNVFAPEVLHGDYPLLLTSFIARCWVLVGHDRPIIPALTAGLFSLSIIGLLGAAVAHLRGLANGLLAALLLATLPELLWFCANQYADLPLSFYMLAAVVLLVFALTAEPKLPALFAAGIMAAFALWTKNEGSSFLLAFVLSCVVLLARAPRGTALRYAAAFSLGLAPVMLLYLGFKLWLAPPGDLFTQRSSTELLRQIGDLSRYKMIGSAVWRMVLSWGGWRIPFLPALAAAVALGGVSRPNGEEKKATVVIAAILALTFLQYMGIFLITPYDLSWHLATALGRLFSQMAAPLLLLVFMVFKRLRSSSETQS